MQALTIQNVRSAMIAVLRDGPLTMAELFAAVMRALGVSPGDAVNSDVVTNTIALLLDGHTFVVIPNRSGKEKIAYRPPPTVPNVRAAMIAELQGGPLTMAKLFTAVRERLSGAPDDNDRDVVANTVILLLDGDTFVLIPSKSGKEKIEYRPPRKSAKRPRK